MATAELELTAEQAEAVAAFGRATGAWGQCLVHLIEIGVDVGEAFSLIGIDLPPFAGMLLERRLKHLADQAEDEAADEVPALPA